MSLLTEQFKRYADRHYEERGALLEPIHEDIEQQCSRAESADERTLLRYYFGTMPATDVFDTEPAVFASFARQALALRADCPWCRDVPEDVFIHYVASPRVNNEPITDCWPVFREELSARLEGRTAYGATIETNYWCGEMATYQDTDERTLGPLGVLASGNGRCGEESTFLVTALRANGIPARQLYTPWWPHCDDNHAWVEAYVEGSWRYLGACEPDEALDRGWFTAASGRAMLVHTRLFSDYGCDFAKDRHLLAREGSQIIVNLTASYAPVVTLDVSVSYEDGTPAANVDVRLQLLNESAWRDIARVTTDDAGRASIEIGKGTLRVVAADERLMAECPLDTAATSRVDLILRELPEFHIGVWTEIDSHAPIDHPAPSRRLTPEQEKQGLARKRSTDLARISRTNELLEVARARVGSCGHDPEACLPYLENAFGNAGEVVRFLSRDDGDDRLDLLSTLTTKDFRDLDASVLEDHLSGARAVRETALSYLDREGAGDAAEDLFIRYVLCPRAAHEQLTPYRSFLQTWFRPEQVVLFRARPSHVWDYLQSHMSFDADQHVKRLIASPRGAMISHQAGPMTMRVLFVAICRTFGIPARINVVDREVEYYAHGTFVPIDRPEETYEQRFLSEAEPAPRYHLSWSIARLRTDVSPNGLHAVGFEELNFRGRQMDEGSCTLDLPRGTYRITTSTRLPSGDIQAAERFFVVRSDGENVPLELYLREPEPSEMLEDIELDHFVLAGIEGGNVYPHVVARTCGSYPYPIILAFLEPGEEPTEHLLNELRKRAKALAKEQVPIVLVLPGDETLSDPTLSRALDKLKNVILATDNFQELPEQLARRMFADPEKLPLTLLLTPEGFGKDTMHGLYAAAGYNVGTVDLMLKLIKLCRKEARHAGAAPRAND